MIKTLVAAVQSISRESDNKRVTLKTFNTKYCAHFYLKLLSIIYDSKLFIIFDKMSIYVYLFYISKGDWVYKKNFEKVQRSKYIALFLEIL